MNIMVNENLKLISIRISPTALERLDDYCKNRDYLKRSAVINRIICAAVFNADFRTFDSIATCWDSDTGKYNLTFEKKEDCAKQTKE